MDRWYSRYKRGDVWFLHLEDETGDGSRTSSSSRFQVVQCSAANHAGVSYRRYGEA